MGEQKGIKVGRSGSDQRISKVGERCTEGEQLLRGMWKNGSLDWEGRPEQFLKLRVYLR